MLVNDRRREQHPSCILDPGQAGLIVLIPKRSSTHTTTIKRWTCPQSPALSRPCCTASVSSLTTPMSSVRLSFSSSPHHISDALLVSVGGIDRDGTGAVYSFDPVGSYERESCRAAGAAQSLVQPFLDAMVNGKNQVPAPDSEPIIDKDGRSNLPLDRVLGLVTDAFTGATEREIYVGDMLEMYIVQVKRDQGGNMIGTELGVLRKSLKED